jgi:antitoxin HicB
MRTYAYAAQVEPGDEGGLVVTFPDLPEAITQGEDEGDARVMAADALGLVLLTYLAQGRRLPEATPVAGGLLVSVEPEVAAKLAILEAFRDAGISKSELARRIGKDEKEVRRLLDPMHATRLPALQAALAALGRRLVVGVEDIAA